ncbi:MAG: hypothetical protein Q7V88_09445 [Actinomycetota bacterium]|nr:hypothetical protein [Actinomycetota bacterium]
MCFSAEADLVGGAVIVAIGVDALRHIRSPQQRPIAALPLMFGLHQLVEAFVWWGLQGKVPAGLGRAAMWVYLVFAFLVLPLYVPLAVRRLELSTARRLAMLPFAVLGLAVTVFLAVAMASGPVTVELAGRHLAYGIGLQYSFLVVGLYVVATCGALMISSVRSVAAFGVLNLVVVAALAWFQGDGLASMWCAWAAVTSAAIVVHLSLSSRAAPAVTAIA